MIGTLAEKGDFNALVAYTGQTGQKLDYMYLLQVCEGRGGYTGLTGQKLDYMYQLQMGAGGEGQSVTRLREWGGAEVCLHAPR